MATYNIVVPNGPWSSQVGGILRRIGSIESLLDKIADEDVLPALARNFDSSGLKTGAGQLKQAISKRGAAGNVIEKHGGTLVVGLNYAQLPGSKWAIEGGGPMRAQNAKALHWKDSATGKDIFAKRVGPSPPHEVYYLTPDDLRKIQEHLARMVLEGK